MKLFFLCLLAGIGISASTYSPPLSSGEDEIIEVAAIRLAPYVAEAYREKHHVSHFTVDEEAMLHPAKGYKLGIKLEERVYVVMPSEWKFQPPHDYDNYAETPIPGGTMFCMCHRGYDDCDITITIENNQIHYFCDGGCNCSSFSESDMLDGKLEVKSMEGMMMTY